MKNQKKKKMRRKILTRYKINGKNTWSFDYNRMVEGELY